jgi:hypothetical protein
MEINTIRDLITASTENAAKKGFTTRWKACDRYCIPVQLLWASGELSGEAFNGWRSNDKVNFLEEIADAFIVLGHVIGDIGEADRFMKILNEKMEFDKTRPYKHGYEQFAKQQE